MQLWNKTGSLWLLSLVSILGLIGMLLLDGVWDAIMLMVTILPMLLAIYRAYRMSQ